LIEDTVYIKDLWWL